MTRIPVRRALSLLILTGIVSATNVLGQAPTPEAGNPPAPKAAAEEPLARPLSPETYGLEDFTIVQYRPPHSNSKMIRPTGM